MDIIQKWMEENVNNNSVRHCGRFWFMYHDKTSASWGWNAPALVNGQRVAWLHFSPQHQGVKSQAQYDFIPEAAWQAHKDKDYEEVYV